MISNEEIKRLLNEMNKSGMSPLDYLNSKPVIDKYYGLEKNEKVLAEKVYTGKKRGRKPKSNAADQEQNLAELDTSEEPEDVTTPEVTDAQVEKEKKPQKNLIEVVDGAIYSIRKNKTVVNFEQIVAIVNRKLIKNGYSSNPIIDMPIDALISQRIYEMALKEAQIQKVKVNYDNFGKLLEIKFSSEDTVNHLMGKLSKEYVRTHYPVLHGQLLSNKHGPYNIEGVISTGHDEVFKKVLETLDRKILSLTDNEEDIEIPEELLQTKVKKSNEKIKPEEVIIGYSFSRKSKNAKSDFTNFWKWAKKKVENLGIQGIKYEFSGLGGAAARGSDHASGIDIKCPESSLPALYEGLEAIFKEAKENRTEKIKFNPIKQKIKTNGQQKPEEPITGDIKKESLPKSAQIKEITYFGSGASGFETYFLLHNALANRNILLTGVVEQEDIRTFNIVNSIRETYTFMKEFRFMTQHYMHTITGKKNIDVLCLNYETLAEFTNSRTKNILESLSDRAIVALTDNSLISSEVKMKIKESFETALAHRGNLEKVAETSGFTMYYASKKE
ncbi:MAG: hypothetical protein ACP5N3_02805 [Candidatus Nanoarchaeia archaeon]